MGKREAQKRTPKAATDENVVLSSAFDDYEPSVTWSIFVCWILPVLVIASMTRFVVDPDAIHGLAGGGDVAPTPRITPKPPSPLPTQPTVVPTPRKKPTPLPTMVNNKPTAYVDVVKAISRRRLDFDNVDSEPMKGHVRESFSSGNGKKDSALANAKKKDLPKKQPRTMEKDSVRLQFHQKVEDLRRLHEEDPDDILKAVDFADALRLYDVQYHDGGSMQKEAIRTHKTAISLALKNRERKLELGEPTRSHDVPNEIFLDYGKRSIDGILCAIYTGLGKVYFMSNMFEEAVESYTKAMDIEPFYLDAVGSRGSSRVILGHYEDAALDFVTVLENDTMGIFMDVYTGLARLLQAHEGVVPVSWDYFIEKLRNMIGLLREQYSVLPTDDPHGKRSNVARHLNRLLHAMFMYHDGKTKDTDEAWKFLTESYKFKMSALPAWNKGFEYTKVQQAKLIFQKGFWPENTGSENVTPIFIIGFPRSGSTLLERVLDAHPQIFGMGENSVFNGQLDEIRNKIVQATIVPETLPNTIQSSADGVVDEMRDRWKMISSRENSSLTEKSEPARFVDKMLTNYANVGFIHLLFPNALILHVFREPMDTIFSSYKHEFPPGGLDYTSDFESLAELYLAYRDYIDYWDEVLPGRIKHVRYDDMVHDMPGVAKKIIEATGLEWDDSILNFHKKKQAVNTLSTSQVRRGVYKDSLQAWKRYEKYLGPMLKLVGERRDFHLKTSLPGYFAPPKDPPEEDPAETPNTIPSNGL